MTDKRIILVAEYGDGGRLVQEGTVVEGNTARGFIATNRIPTLPVDPDLFRRNAVAGYFKRAWGKGWSFDPHMPARGCPMVIYSSPDYAQINWCAQVRREDADAPVRGTLRLSTDTGQRGIVTGSLVSDHQPVDLSQVRFTDGVGYIGGVSRLTSSLEGFLGLSLYGTAENVRVRWAAVTQTA